MNDQHTTVAQLKGLMADFVAQRDWQKYHDPKNLSASIAIEAAELMEHFQWLRSDELEAVKSNAQAIAEIAEEAADVAAYLLSFCDVLGIDLSAALADKMVKNAAKYPADKFRGRFKAD